MAASKDVAASSDVAVMSDTDKAAAYDQMMAEKANASGPPRYRVVVSDPKANDRTLFSSVSEKRAKNFIEQRCPRGSHFFLLTPDGRMLSYEHERHSGGPQGEEVDVWQDFDRAAYTSPELVAVNVHDPWADAWEGVQ